MHKILLAAIAAATIPLVTGCVNNNREVRVEGWHMRLITAALGILALMVAWAGAPAQAKGPFGSIKVGHWAGGAYTDDNTGAFSHCAAGAPYLSNVALIISLNVADQWNIGFYSPTFNLSTGETFPIEVTFDGQSKLHLFGTAIGPQGVGAMLPSNTLLRKSQIMVAEAKGATFQFQLKDMDRTVSAIATCVAKTKLSGVAAAGDFSAPPPPKPAATPTVAKSTESEPPIAPEKPSKMVNIHGTGFIISTGGHILTNNHVIRGCVGDIHGNLTGEPTTTLRLVSQDETNDLALLQAAGTFKDPARVRAAPIRSGDAIIAIGYPFHGLLTSDFTVTTGIVNSLSGLFNDTRFLQISAQVEPGNSGGPLLDTSGNVVGVVAEKLNAVKFAKVTGDIPQNVNFAIKTGAVRDFLDNSVVPYQSAEPTPELKTAEIAKNARAYTMLISCSVKEETSRK
jgi:S1-C subfamily serine protease